MNSNIEAIAGSKQLAVVGVSDKKFGGYIYKELKKRGYKVYPVHPTRDSFCGDTCYTSLTKLPTSVKAAIIAVSPESATAVVKNASSAGMTHLWFQQGKDFSEAITNAESLGLQTVSRKCILMYAQPVTGLHAIHRALARLFGKL